MSKVKISPKENLAYPGKPLTKEAFKSMVEEAEKGQFHSIEESKRLFKKWRKEKYRL